MQRYSRDATGRRGFTLVELLVVIAIIAVLMALVAAAYVKILGKGPDMMNRSDIQQLSISLDNFKTYYGDYPPSRLKLAKYLTSSTYPQAGTPGTLDYASVKFLTSGKWKRITNQWQNTDPKTGGINWDGGLDPKFQAGTPVVLEGDQCLVFFLGGIPQANGVTIGFSNSVTDPADLTNANDRLKPFFTFKSARLIQRGPSVFYSYQDSYASSNDTTRVFAYFSSYGKVGYNAFYLFDDPLSPKGRSDCQTLGVWPYAETVGAAPLWLVPQPRYLNPNSFQIISAGRDGVFGPGTDLTTKLPKSPQTWSESTTVNQPPAGKDDQSNFYPRDLGGS